MNKYKDFHNFSDKQIIFLLEKLKSKKMITVIILISFFSIFIFGPFSLLAVPIIYFAIYNSIKSFFEHRQFMKEFAKENNLMYSPILDKKELRGYLHKKGHGKKAWHNIYGEYKNHPVKIFNYSYTVGSGKNKTVYSFTVSEIKFKDLKFPYIFLNSNSMWIKHSNEFSNKIKKVKINLNTIYDQSFNLYCEEDYEIEVLQIFTEDLLDYLHLNGNNFSIEFVEDTIYIYDDVLIKNKTDLDLLFNITKDLINKTGNLITRMKDDFEAMHSAYKKD